MSLFSEIVEMIGEAETVLLLPHINADGDSLGSAGALAAFLRAAGKSVTLMCQEPVENKLSFLPRKTSVEFQMIDERPEGLEQVYDLAVAIDTSTADRLGSRLKLYEKARAKARIDHHLAGVDFSDHTVLNTEWAATAEGIYLLLREMGFDADEEPVWLTDDVRKAVAICIYTALVTDTGCFAYSNVTPQTHIIASRMRALGGNMSFIYHHVFEVKTMAYTRLMKIVYEKVYFPWEGIAALILTKEDFDSCGAGDADAEGMGNILRSIEGIHVGIFVKPDKVPGRWRVSMRSDDCCDVSAIAALYGGGGHKCAAGCGFTARDQTSLEREMAGLIDAVKGAVK